MRGAQPSAGTDESGSTAARSGTPGDLVASLFDHSVAMAVGTAIAAVVLVLLYAGVAPAWKVTVWAGAFTLVWLLRLTLAWAWRRQRPADDDAASRRWLQRWNAATLASGAVWGLAAWLFYGSGDAMHHTALVIIVQAFCVASIAMLASQRRIFVGFLALAFAPMVLRIASAGEPHNLALAGILVLIFAATALMGHNYSGALEHVLELRARSQQLLAQLRVEKSAADAARRDAEVANRAKTQFFAAASHDLRQPLHALGLFAEALRGRSQDVEVVQLVNSINSSVDALEGLFSELLDITRIDTGGVEVRPIDFAVEDVLRKLRLHFEPLAFEKGLALRIRSSALVVRADPLLVERVLRNLVSNAIRYTVDGGVLVGARRRGDRVVLQVWDSGLGIQPHDQQRIFEEFVQLAEGAPALQAHQHKGLGLGLAIVRRLATLMGAPLALRSLPGRGTVFSLELPAGRAVRAAESSVRPAQPLGLTLDRRLIVVVEDDEAVRRGLEVMLMSWGASVMAFDSHAACAQWAQGVEPALLQPDLLIVDYRLEDAHTGIEVIDLLREVFGARLPALMVSGSMMSSPEQLADEHGFHLLLKPVVPSKLRAMIAFKLGLR